MQTVATNITISEYCAGMNRLEIKVNKEYQRSDKVWPPAARSFLIETILQGYPIPKIYLYQMTDVKSKKTIKEIVDGQQRSTTIHDFFQNKLRLSKNAELEEARGRIYDELSDELKERFLNYPLTADLFLGASPIEVREAFRRLNSYTVPLNPEEKRHAIHQGEFKWFIYRLAHQYEEAFIRMGVFGDKQIVRMSDAKLITELAHAFLFGVKTTKSKELDKLYQDRDAAFPEKSEIKTRIETAVDFIIGRPEIHNGPLMKPHIFYSLVIAVAQSLHPLPNLNDAFDPPADLIVDGNIAASNLTTLAQALESDEEVGNYKEFVTACSAKTNVDTQRKTRIKWLGKALLPELL
jgi:hypothetical protein